MATPVHHKTSTPLGSYVELPHQFRRNIDSTLPVVKSPVNYNRPRWRAAFGVPSAIARSQSRRLPDVKPNNAPIRESQSAVSSAYLLQRFPSSACFETAFTTAEPQTRIVPHNQLTMPRRSHSSDYILQNNEQPPQTVEKEHGSYHSLDRLRSKSGGYVNVAAFGGSVDGLDRSGPEWSLDSLSELCLSHGRSISSLSCHRATGLSPTSFSDSNMTMTFSRRHPSSNDSPEGLDGQLRIYRNSPSKRLIGRRKGLEFYYGAKACRPGLLTAEGKDMAIKLLQLITLLLPPDRRRKFHLMLRFMAKASANQQLVLDRDVATKTLMINTFYRCIVCAPDEADYDELLAVRLVTFLMENAEAIMTVPHQLCIQVRDLLVEIQREKIRFQPDDAVPLTYCQQVSTQRFEQEGRSESEVAIRQLLEHIVDDRNMSMKEKRKRLKQFRAAYPEIYSSRFPKDILGPNSGRKHSHNSLPRGARFPTESTVLAKIRNLRLL